MLKEGVRKKNEDEEDTIHTYMRRTYQLSREKMTQIEWGCRFHSLPDPCFGQCGSNQQVEHVWIQLHPLHCTQAGGHTS